ncbi:hypothetical protein PRZ48_005117 [Zasmidium cellare]|uniref:Uncharacterized protein n=1 Tax=Zasmidium cellare TaxID=395010 RepID=A0ABR0ESV7_ZASCE|nr:hypothetical protein PRZ48_005117 [Zasmidium cellare]
MSLHNHICGCYFTVNNYHRRYLPQICLESHTTISPVAFTTKLTQTFHNPLSESIKSLRYAFPLYDGVAVNGYSISYDNKTIVGVVQQKEDAKQTFQAAVDRGETAGLLESLPAGVFGVTLGNVPAKTEIVVELTYAGELKHDAAIDGLRYNLPTSIAPRYGSYPGELLQTDAIATKGISITVDIDMGKSAIRRVQSPSHPIALSMGELSTTAKDSNNSTPFSPSQASAALTQGTTELSGDFILQLLIDDISKPQAILEIHPTLPAQRAIMTTMVPKFVLEPAHPEIVFIADQSGSMSGSKNAALVKALKIFLKSLPIGVRFNICAFGSSHKFLWPTSQAYSETNVKKALSFVEGLSASYGGTEIFPPIEDTFRRHLKDMPLEVMLLTDGEVWAEQRVFGFINEQIRDKNVDARVFGLGIGQDVSHTLVEGVARAGNGFAQFVTQNEDTDQKVIRMLKGALYAHTRDYELEVHYADEEKMEDEDDFEIVEKVNDCLVINDQAPAETTPQAEAKPKSFFDTSAELDKLVNNPQGADRYAHLPPVDEPKVLQAPANIPPLFPFNRTTAYLLLGPESAQKDVKSVTLRAKSPQGPLELNIPIQGVQSGTSIHQLAARKAIQELEEGRGWLQSVTVRDATDEKVAIKKKYESRFDEMVEREGVRLGVKFQVASKWTSFVAVEDKNEAGEDDHLEHEDASLASQRDRDIAAKRVLPPVGTTSSARMSSARAGRGGRGFREIQRNRLAQTATPFAQAQQQNQYQPQAYPASGGLFGQAQPQMQAYSSSGGLFGQTQQTMPQYNTANFSRGSLFGNVAASVQAGYAPQSVDAMQGQTSPFGAASTTAQPRISRMMRMAPPPQATAFESASSASSAASSADAGVSRFLREESEDEDEDMGYGLFDAPGEPVPAPALAPAPQISPADMQRYVDEMQSAACMPLPDEDDEDVASVQFATSSESTLAKKKQAKKKSSGNPLHDLIDLQTFSGSWTWSEEVFAAAGLEVNSVDISILDHNPVVAATALIVAYFETKLADKKDVWEMVVAKARNWLVGQMGGKEKVEEVLRGAERFIGEN